MQGKSFARWALCLLLIALATGAPGGVSAADIPEAPAAPAVCEVRITGATRVPSEKLLAVLETRAGKAFNLAVLEKDIKAIEDLYRQEGYPLAHVTAGFGINTDGVVTIPVEEGRIEKVVVKGNRKTRAHVITRELLSQPGEVYSAHTVAADRARLYRLNLFNSVSVGPAAGSDPGKAILMVEVSERYTGDVSGALGYTGDGGILGYASWSDTNFLGTGQTLSVNWQRGAYSSLLNFGTPDEQYQTNARTGYDIGYFAPWVLSRGLSAGVRLYDTSVQQLHYFNQDIDQGNIKNYEWRRGALVTMARALPRGLTLGVLGRHDNVDFSVAPLGALPPPGEVVAPTSVSSVRLSVARGPFNPFSEQQRIPRTGAYLEVGSASTGGLSGTYQKYGVTATHYVTLSPKDTVAGRLQVGWSSGNVPFSELYSVGGPQTVRSYAWNRFLGTRMMVLNTEWRHALKPGLAVAGFVDLGYAWPRYSSFDIGEVRPGVGLGLRAVTPFGPIRLDYGYGRDGGRVHLTMGDPF